MELPYVKIFLDWGERTQDLSDTEKGRLMDAIVAFARGEAFDDYLKGGEKYVFRHYQLQRIKDVLEAEERAKKMSENGSKGGRPKKQKVFSESKKSQEEEKEKEEEKEDYSLTFSNENVCRTDAVRRIAEAWNTLGLQNISKITSGTQRDTMLKARLKEYTEDEILQGIEKVRESSFLMGKTNQGWTCTFDWFIRPNNFPKVLSGNYDDAAPKEQPKTNDELEKMTFRSGPVFSDERLERLKQKEAARESTQASSG